MKTKTSPGVLPRIVDDYTQHLRENKSCHLSLTKYCQQRNVSLKSVSQWMTRHGISASQLKVEALPELYSPVIAEVTPADHSEKMLIPIAFHSHSSNKRNISASENNFLIKGVNITFPDGVIVTIKEVVQQDLNQFIRSYNNR
jgi:hypothetical protein